MADYFVDGINGSDSTGSGEGSSASNPWATVTYALSQIGNGNHTLWIAPGNYFETINVGNDGTDANNPFSVRGDPNCIQSWGSGVVPGIVRISAANSSTLAIQRSGTAIRVQNGDYVHLYDLVADGGQHGIYCDRTTTKLFRCIGIGYQYGIYGQPSGTAARYCVGIGGHTGMNNGSPINCLLMGGSRGYSSGTAESCILLGGDIALYAAIPKNCILLGRYGAYQPSATGGGNIHFCNYYGSRTGTYATDSIEVGCYYTNNTSEQDLSSAGVNWRSGYHYTDGSQNNPVGTLHLFNLSDPMTMIRSFAQAFNFSAYNDYDLGDSNATAETEDIEGRTRPMRSNGETSDFRCPGPAELPDVVHQAADKIRIQKKGEEVFYVPVEAGTNVTVTVTISINQPGTGELPQLELLEPDEAGGWTQLDIDTASSNSDTSLSVTGSPTSQDKICTVKLITRDTDTGAYTDFSDITIS